MQSQVSGGSKRGLGSDDEEEEKVGVGSECNRFGSCARSHDVYWGFGSHDRLGNLVM